MKTIIFSLILACINTSSIFSQIFKNQDLTGSKLENNVWVIETSDNTTMYLIEGSKKALLIDTGTKCDSLDKVISHITNLPYDVVLTHGHGDHSGNIKYFSAIYMHEADIFFISNEFRNKLKFINEGYIFDLGNKQIEVKCMPAHTPGSIVLIDWQAKSCYTGDAFGSGQVWLQVKPIASMKTYISSCNNMLSLMDTGIEKLYCGHYPYPKKVLTKDYMNKMKVLAVSIVDGTVQSAKPFPTKFSISCENPMIAGDDVVAIVYDPEHVK
jgi:hydroxyacylglutathione hydrolase